jgi:metal-sulfur cluster biosynthetic enzyme
MQTEYLLSNFFFPLLTVAIAYPSSALMARTGVIRRDVHRTVWNFALLAFFLGCSGTGVMLAGKQFLPDLGPIVRLHNQMGACLLAGGAGHTMERLPYFLKKMKFWWGRMWATDNHWPQVLASLVALSALLALPSVLVRLTAGDARASVGPDIPVRVPANPVSKVEPILQDSTSPRAVHDTEPVARGKSPTHRVKASLADEVERVLALGRDATGNGNASGGAVRIENHSGVDNSAIEVILRQVHDPELRINVFDLGLVRRIEVDSQANIAVSMVFTTPTCPNNGWLVDRMRSLLTGSSLFRTVEIHDIPNTSWSPDFITEEGHRILLEMGKW